MPNSFPEWGQVSLVPQADLISLHETHVCKRRREKKLSATTKTFQSYPRPILRVLWTLILFSRQKKKPWQRDNRGVLTWISLWQSEISNSLLVQAQVPPDCDVILGLRVKKKKHLLCSWRAVCQQPQSCASKQRRNNQTCCSNVTKICIYSCGWVHSTCRRWILFYES